MAGWRTKEGGPALRASMFMGNLIATVWSFAKVGGAPSVGMAPRWTVTSTSSSSSLSSAGGVAAWRLDAFLLSPALAPSVTAFLEALAA